ncbi:hypothetical protein Hanom_Chr15g01374411 [Helianthus anomalus]
MSSAKQVSKFVEALSAEWNEIVINLKKDSSFSNFGLREFISKLNSYKFEREERKKELLKGITKNVEKISLDVILEMERRINVCPAAKRVMKYDIKRGCYIDKNMNPLDFVKNFCACIFEESVKIGSSNSESACSKSDKFEADNVKLLKNV